MDHFDHFHLHRADSWWSFNKCSSCSSSHAKYKTYRIVTKVRTGQSIGINYFLRDIQNQHSILILLICHIFIELYIFRIIKYIQTVPNFQRPSFRKTKTLE